MAIRRQRKLTNQIGKKIFNGKRIEEALKKIKLKLYLALEIWHCFRILALFQSRNHQKSNCYFQITQEEDNS